MAQVKVCTESAREVSGEKALETDSAFPLPTRQVTPNAAGSPQCPNTLPLAATQGAPEQAWGQARPPSLAPQSPRPSYLLRRRAQGCSDGSVWRTGTGLAHAPGSPR